MDVRSPKLNTRKQKFILNIFRQPIENDSNKLFFNFNLLLTDGFLFILG
jgi:hypothetical protein